MAVRNLKLNKYYQSKYVFNTIIAIKIIENPIGKYDRTYYFFSEFLYFCNYVIGSLLFFGCIIY